MNSNYRLQSGQINFRSLDNSNSYACIVIIDGVFYNMTDDLKKILLNAISSHRNVTLNIEDMF